MRIASTAVCDAGAGVAVTMSIAVNVPAVPSPRWR
jgi:hypothetical protein